MRIPTTYSGVFLLLQSTIQAEHKAQSAWQRRVDTLTAQAARRAHPRRKAAQLDPAQPWKIRNSFPELYQSTFARLLPDYQAQQARREARLVALRAARDAMAETALPEITATETVAHRGCSGDYWSQGFAATKYAEAAARRVMDSLESLGIPCRLESSDSGERYDHGIRNFHFTVLANTDEAGVDLAKRKPIDLVERVRLFWKRGVNPRVDMPFLPYGFEESNGLDYFGGYVNAATA